MGGANNGQVQVSHVLCLSFVWVWLHAADSESDLQWHQAFSEGQRCWSGDACTCSAVVGGGGVVLPLLFGMTVARHWSETASPPPDFPHATSALFRASDIAKGCHERSRVRMASCEPQHPPPPGGPQSLCQHRGLNAEKPPTISSVKYHAIHHVSLPSHSLTHK